MFNYVTNQRMVQDFHRKYGCSINVPITRDELNLRYDLILEEFVEVEVEMGKVKTDKELLTKELADLLYVTYGAAIALGLPIQQAFRRTHLSNMTKTVPSKATKGKIQKGVDYEPPVLRDLFEGIV